MGNYLFGFIQSVARQFFGRPQLAIPDPSYWNLPEKALLDNILLAVLINRDFGGRIDRQFNSLKFVSKEWFDSVVRVYRTIGSPLIYNVPPVIKIKRANYFLSLLLNATNEEWSGYRLCHRTFIPHLCCDIPLYTNGNHSSFDEKLCHVPYACIDLELPLNSSVRSHDLLSWHVVYDKACKHGIKKFISSGKKILNKGIRFCYDGSSWHMGYYIIMAMDARCESCTHTAFFYIENNVQNLVPMLCSISFLHDHQQRFYTMLISPQWRDHHEFSSATNAIIETAYDNLIGGPHPYRSPKPKCGRREIIY